ncbi:amino acid adenylation domain-containing protein [Paenibacillus sp. FSL H7-0357]|uniref:non-ribosomal peptide synthetase n=2 Tax=Paenibacillus sp. FSL H7-0357 TaxID=1536774 RepID=UPI003FA53A51
MASSGKYSEAVDYWLEQLAESPAPTTLSLGREGVIAGQSFRQVEQQLSNETLHRVESLSKNSEQAMFMVLMSGTLLFLSRYLNLTDLLVGMPPLKKKGSEEVASAVLPIRIQIRSESTFRDVLIQVRNGLTEAAKHQKFPHPYIAEKTGLPMNRNELLRFGTIVSLNSIHQTIDPILSECLIHISFQKKDDTLSFVMHYDASRYAHESLIRLKQQLVYFLDLIMEQINTPLAQIDMVSDQEKQELLHAFNDTVAEYPQEATIHGLFEEQVKKTPDAVAAVYGDQQLTYAELNARANQLAWTLRGQGVGPDRIVAILMDRSVEMLVGMLGILKAGGAYLPIDPDYPAERIAYTLADSGAEWLVTTRDVELRTPALPFAGCRVYALETEPMPAENPPQATKPEHLAYVIYTSGTTGKPKGTMITHRNVVRLLFNDRMAFDFNERDVWTLFHSYCFDFSVWEMYGALLYGGKLVVVPLMTARDPEQMVRLLRQERVTVLNQTPSAFYALSEREMEEADAELCVRAVIFGGEALAPVQLRAWQRKYPHTELINMYGITETTVHVTYKKLGEAEITSGISNIGKPLPTLRAYILGEGQQLQPMGVAGELCITGDGLARGYLNRPELTAEKFVDNPFEPGTRMYRTGDLARWLPDGNLEYLGRIDHQVKIRGYRIECGEIEAHLMAHAQIREAVVMAREDEQGQAYLCAYLVSDEAVPVPELRAHLAVQLPEYMIPAYFVELEKLPLNSNGKVDRKALPAPDREAYSEGYEAPRDALETQLAELFAEVLGVNEVGIGDSFFERGGHSLKAMTLVSRIHQQLAVELPLRELFARPTVKALAVYVRSTEESGYGRIEPASAQASYPLSSAQRRLYVLHEVEPESTRYNMPGVMELTGQVDADRLEQAIRSVIARHESLRTSFTWIDGEPRQQVHEDVVLEWVCRDADEGQARELIRNFVQPFALGQAPLLRAGLLRLAEERHWLVWDMHHIVSDGVSMNLLVSDFMAAYAGGELAPLRIQYKDYAVWQQSTLEVERMQGHEAYWLSVYAEEAPVLELRADRTRPAVPSSEGGQVHAQISADVAEGLKQIAAETGATLYMVLLAAYNVWLHKYTGQSDIVVGTPVSGRTHADTEPMIGMFVNTLALRNAPSGEKRFMDFLREVKERTLAAFEHQDYPFEELVEKLNVRRDMSRNPMFDTMLVLQNMEQARFTLADVDVRPVELNHRATKFDLTLNVAEGDQGLQLLLEYSSALFNEETAGRYLMHFVQLLSQITGQPEASIGSYELVTPEEKQQLLHGFNDTAAEYPREATIHGLFEEQVEKTPHAVAVVYGDQQLTYAELNAQANQLAWTLRGQGVGPDRIVAILMGRSVEMLVGVLGILKAGGAYLPIDPALPAERIRYMLGDSGAGVLLIQPGLDPCGFEGTVLDLAEAGQAPAGVNFALHATSGELAYVIYTSGTTGNPKGVMIEHRSVVNFITGMTRVIPFAPAKSILFATTLSFDISVVETLLALTQGMRVVAASEEQQKDPQQLAALIERQRIGMVQMTPSRLKMLLSAGCVAWLEGVTEILVGGEAWTDDLLADLQSKSKAVLFNMYGPTETTIWSAVREATVDQTVTVGGPIANTQLYIVSDNRQLQPIGVAGELCIAGDGLARGYFNRPELTAEKFVDNPFEPGTRMYRTGDLARWLPDGNLEYLGRIDHQVKIRGYRIECGEIEMQLMAHAQIREAVVMACEDEQGQAYLCAYLVSDESVPVPELRAHLAAQLPDYMIPSYFVELEKLPLNSNGKVDRKALPAPDREAYSEGYEAPRDALETQLAELFAEVLGVNEVGIGDSFFERGGHSLKAMTLVSRMHQQLAVELPLRELFARPTVKALAVYVRSTEESGYGRIEPAEAQASYALSSAQRRLYVLHEVEPESTRYNMPGVVELTGQVDADRLEEAIRSVIARHESLRTSFTWIDGEPRQQVHEDVAFEWVCRDADEVQARELVRNFVRPFALDQAPLLRIELLRLAEERHWLVWDMHHIVSDGVSMNLLVSDFMAAYAGEELAPLRIQYKDYAVWQQGTLGVERMEAHEAYWLSAYAEEAPVLELPADRTRPAVLSSEGGRVYTEVNAETAEALKRIAAETGATLYMVLLAAYNVWLHKYTGQSDIVVGTPVSGRTHGDTEPMIGMFVNTLALRNAPSGEKRFMDFVREVKERTLAAFEHQDYPFEELVEKLNVRRDMSHNPLFDTMLVLQNMEQARFGLADVDVRPVELNHRATKFDLTLNVAEGDQGLQLLLEYSCALFNGETAGRYLMHFVQLLSQITGQPEARIGSISLVTAEEKQQLLHTFNDTAAEYPQEATIHGLFEAQVEKTPDAVAAVYGDQQLTYAELNARANQLAWTLRGQGVGPDRIVAILMDRSVEMLVGMLGILKAGGAYLPIDPDYPAERIAYTLADSGAEWLVTTRDVELRTPALPFAGCRVYALETELMPAENPPQATKPEHLAYVIYTSGTTGKPKGTMITHRNVVRLLFNDRMAFDFNERDVWTLFHSYCFDFSVWEMYGALLYGGKLVVVPLMTARDPEQMVRLLRQERVTVLNQTPSAFYALSEREMEEADAELCVRAVIFGGEALAPVQLRAWQRKYPHTELINMYGITETTVHVTYKKLGEAEITSGISNIGKPLPTLRAYILGEGQQLQPMGVAGELCITGDGLARGYLNRPELTAEKFVDNPFEPGTRMYRTGDLARWLPDGNLEYLGRIDHQVKIRGYRIECGEIEVRLLAHAQIREAVVMARGDEQGQAYLCAYLVSDEAVPVVELRAHLAVQLPEYMIPSYFVELEKLPLNSNGKVERKALPAPESAHTGSVYEAPSTPTQRQLAEIWQEVLGAEQVGVHDNFFVLGGDSIKAIRLVSRMNRDMEAALPLKDVYLHQTIGELAELLAQEHKPNRQLESGREMLEQMKRRIMEDSEQAKHLPEDYEDVYPLSKIQQSMVFYSRLRPEEPIYHDQFLYHFKIVSVEQFAEALQRLSDRHPILRTTFDLTHFEEEVQLVHDRIVPEFSVEDVSSLSREEQERVIRAHIDQDQRNLFRFDGEVLWRVRLFRQNARYDYCMVFTFHHAILDGWSVASFQQEFAGIYQQLLQGKPADIKPLDSNYKDYVAINRFRESDEESRQYWIRELAGYTRNKLPFNYAGKKRDRGAASKIYRRPLSSTLLEALKRQAKRYGCTVKELCLSAHVYLLGILTTEEEIVTGVVSHDRPAIEDADKVLGCFLNTVPIRMGLAREVSKRELVNRTKRQLGQMKAHELFLADIAQAIGEVSSPSVNPIFDTLFNYTDFHVLEEMGPGQELASEMAALSLEANEMTNTWFDLEVSQYFNRLNMQIKYAPAYFEDQEIETAFAWYERILEALCDEETDILSVERLMATAERQAIVYEWNRTDMPYAAEKTLHQLFEEQAARTPGRTALNWNGQPLTYWELDERSNRLARRLRAQGVKLNDHVGLMTGRGFEMIVGMLAILKAGAAYVPMDPDYPQSRIAHMISHAGVSVVVVDQAYAEAPALFVDSRDPSLIEHSGEALHLAKDSHELAYIIYTSGSTGEPKGVMIEHHSAVNLVSWVNREFGVHEEDRLLFITSMCFDLSVYDIFGPLAAGAQIVIASREQVQDPKQMQQLLEEEAITIWDSVPTTLNHVLHGLEEQEEAISQKALRLALVSGDWIPVDLAERAKAYFPNVQVIGLGGATEATVWSNYYPIQEVTADQTGIPYGKPLANNTFYILDADRHPVPYGVAGELYIGGVGVARGYLNDPAKTSASFMTNPFVPQGRMYRTGDMGRMLQDGNMEFLGRQDYQVKIRGYRVELGEIENQLLKHEAVREAVVIAREDAAGGKYLCAYVVLQQETASAEIREHLGRALPSYMIPGYMMPMERLPLTPNGKLNRKALPEPDARMHSEERYEAASTETERKLLGIWEDVLGVENIGMSDDFFAIGGHSLRATALVSKIQKTMNVELTLQDVFRLPTIKEQARKIEGMSKMAYSAIEPAKPGKDYPLSSAQRRLYVLHEVEPESTRYNMPGVVELTGKIDADRLEQAVRSVIARHESLRTSFTWIDGEPRQQVHEDVALEWVCRDADEAQARELTRSFVRPFELSQAPLLRTGLLRLAEERHWLVWDMHHIVSDGVSMNLLVSDFMAAYAGGELAPLRIQYKDYAVWQQGTLGVERMQGHEAYWLSAYAEEAPVLELPADRRRPAVPSSEGGRVYTEVNAETAEALKRIAAETGATLYMVLLAAYNVWLHKYTGQTDIVVGTPVSGRTHGDTEPMIGMFVNTLALRNAPSGEKRFMDFVREVKERTLVAFEHQDYPFEELVEKLNVRRDRSRNPLFDTMLVLQNMEQARFTLADVDVRPVELNHLATKFDLTLNVAESDQGLQLMLEYSCALFNEETAGRYLMHFMQLLSQIIGQPEASIGSYELVTPEEKQQLLHGFNDTAAEYPREATIHGLFEEQVKKTPHAVAAVYGEQQLTYTELNARANQLAWTLCGQGMGPDHIVAILMERSVEMIVGVLGILKAGGAYLPIDPAYPAERIQYMLEDSGSQWLIGDEALLAETAFAGAKLGLTIAKAETAATGTMSVGESSSIDGCNLEAVSGPENLAYVIYTSGSTGRPKGVMAEHRSVANLTSMFQRTLQITGDDRILQFASLSFDASLSEIVMSLCSGAQLHIVPVEVIHHLGEFEQYIRENGITVITLPPAYLTRMHPEQVRPLRTVITAGSACPQEVVRKWSPYVNLINAYGPTETTVCATMWPADEAEEEMGIVPIGKPVSNVRVYILDQEGRLLPMGVPGEICLTGAGVARGYLNRPDLTAEKFVDNPFEPGMRMYRTGDLARWLPDGNLEYLGRTDHQVKIRGYRIECGEIEAQLQAHGHIREAVVVDRKDEQGQAYLCAYLVCSMPLTVAQIHAHLSRHLPDYMIPSYFVELDHIPLNNNGKVNRTLLPVPDVAMDDQEEKLPPATEIESGILKVWQEVLHKDDIGVTDNFFHVGGNSLRIMDIYSKLEQKYPGVLVVADLFGNPNVRQLAQYIETVHVQKQASTWKHLPLAFPTSGMAEQGVYIPGDVLRFELSERTSQSLERISSHYSIQKMSVLLTAFAYLMSEYAHTETVTLPCLIEGGDVYRVEVSFREAEELEEVFAIVDGYLKTEGRFHWDQVKYAAYEPQEGQILCAFTGADPLPSGFAKQFDLVLNCGEAGIVQSMTCEYNQGRILQTSIERLLRQFVSLLAKMLEQCEKKVGL